MSIHSILKEYWGYDQFRPLQEDIIQSVLKGDDTLALLPTGGGKSICFQVPGMAIDGVCLVISPLIALMKDQVENLAKLGIGAGAIYSGMHSSDIKLLLNNCIHGGVKFLYVSPERLSTSIFRDALMQMNIGLLAIDEAHCISQWGFDFRPEYRKIKEVRDLFPKVSVMALTATATPKVVDDIQDQLGFKKKTVFRKSFERLNLSYIVRYHENKLEKVLESIQKIPGSGLVYVRNRKMCEEISKFLLDNGISASFYHAGLNLEERQNRQKDWIMNQTRIMVCTNAFGMGIDKPDCGLVIHYEMPDCLEAYYQEAGRAGRNGRKAYCLLLFHPSDAKIMRHKLSLNYPDEKYLKLVYDAYCNHFQIAIGAEQSTAENFEIASFSKHINRNPLQVLQAIKLLSQLEILYTNEGLYHSSMVKVLLKGNALFAYEGLTEIHSQLLQQILRSYGGIFEAYIPISEKALAIKLNCSEQQLKDWLTKLDELLVISYQPSTDKPQIQLIGERVSSNYLRLNPVFIRERKKMEEEKLEAMIAYCENTKVCRSRSLLAYFDEKQISDCGVCDVCKENKQLFWTEERLQSFLNQIKSLNWSEPIEVKKFVSSFFEYPEEHLVQAIRILLDKGILQLNIAQQLIWTKEN